MRRVIAVVSNKGGVGKTTVAANLAIYLRALYEQLPVLLLSLDDQSSVERMFRLGARPLGERTLRHVFVDRTLDGSIQLGQYGVHFVPPATELEALKVRAADPFALRRILERSAFTGVVLLDTKSDLEALTRSALAAADVAILPVADRASCEEAERAFRLLEANGGSRARGRVLLTLIDRRTKLDSDGRDLYERLVAAVDAHGWPRFATPLSRSPRVEALNSGQGRPHSILHEARGTAIHRQLRELTEELVKLLALEPALPPEALPAPPAAPPAPARDARPDLVSGLRSALLRGLRGRR
jgi:cellulose biosynthesis protein BcsQ